MQSAVCTTTKRSVQCLFSKNLFKICIFALCKYPYHRVAAINPSDISREKFELIRSDLESFRYRTKPRTVDLYDVLRTFIRAKSGCQWRMLPNDFPKWRTAHKYFLLWGSKTSDDSPSMLEQVLKKTVGQASIKLGRNECPTLGIVDAQSVKNTDSAEQKGYDAGKRVSGIKRYIIVDNQGLPQARAVTTANVTDRTGAIEALKVNSSSLGLMVNLLVDGGYTGEPFASKVKQLVQTNVKIVKRNKLHCFTIKLLLNRYLLEISNLKRLVIRILYS